MANNSANYGAFIPTSQVWDVSEIMQTEVTSPAFKELLVRLYQNMNNISMSVNQKESAFYTNDEFVTGQQFPPVNVDSRTQSQPAQRQSFRKMIDFGALPNAATKSIPHGLIINSGFSFTRIYATSTNTATLNFVPIPYVSVNNTEPIEIWVDATNVNIATISDYSGYTITYVILEYLKN
jgi:hypothetical protein